MPFLKTDKNIHIYKKGPKNNGMEVLWRKLAKHLFLTLDKNQATHSEFRAVCAVTREGCV